MFGADAEVKRKIADPSPGKQEGRLRSVLPRNNCSEASHPNNTEC